MTLHMFEFKNVELVPQIPCSRRMNSLLGQKNSLQYWVRESAASDCIFSPNGCQHRLGRPKFCKFPALFPAIRESAAQDPRRFVGVSARAKPPEVGRRREGTTRYCRLSATKRSSPSALATRSNADLRPSILSWSTRFCSASVSPTASCDTSTTTSPALSRLSAAGDWASTPVITTPLTVSLIL